MAKKEPIPEAEPSNPASQQPHSHDHGHADGHQHVHQHDPLIEPRLKQQNAPVDSVESPSQPATATPVTVASPLPVLPKRPFTKPKIPVLSRTTATTAATTSTTTALPPSTETSTTTESTTTTSTTTTATTTTTTTTPVPPTKKLSPLDRLIAKNRQAQTRTTAAAAAEPASPDAAPAAQFPRGFVTKIDLPEPSIQTGTVGRSRRDTSSGKRSHQLPRERSIRTHPHASNLVLYFLFCFFSLLGGH